MNQNKYINGKRFVTLNAAQMFLLLIFVILMATGCCVTPSTRVRNETDKILKLTTYWQSQQIETVTIPARSTGRCVGVMPIQPPTSWVISDGQSRFIFTNVSPIAVMPSEFVSNSRFTSNFPCKRFTQHVSIASDMTIHAMRVIGYTESEPPAFPIHFTKKEAAK